MDSAPDRSRAGPGLGARLDAALRGRPDIAGAVCFDLRAGIVLGASRGLGLPQEALDGLCRAAAAALDGPARGPALLASALELVVVERLRADALALGVVFAPDTPLDVARAAAPDAAQATEL